MFNEVRAAPLTRAEKSLPGRTTRKSAAEADRESVSASSGEHRNIPAILPYEVKEALLRDMREDDTKSLKDKTEQSQVRLGSLEGGRCC